MAQVTKRVLIECGVAETRAALMIGDIVWKFWFGPARGDEATDRTINWGRRFAGRIRSINNSLNAAFVDIGEGQTAFLPLKTTTGARLAEGALIEAEVTAPPRQNKGAVVKFVSMAAPGVEAGRLPPFPDPALEAAEALAHEADEIIVDEGAVKSLLGGAGFRNAVHESGSLALFEKFSISDALGGAFDPVAPLDEGGRIIIDEAHALTAIDVDTSELNAASTARLREKIARAAARESIRQISLRNIGGHVVIDFPNLSGNIQRKRFDDFLTNELARLDGAKAQSFSKSGLFSFTLPRRTLSLMDRFTEHDAMEPAPGRRFTAEAKAKAAIRALEHRLQARPSLPLRLEMGPALGEYLDDKTGWRDRLREKYGARINYTVADNFEEHSFDISEQ